MPADISKREPEHPLTGEFLRDIVFGANDGVVTAIGFMVGIAGTSTEQSLIVVAGILTIVAGAASMALGNYLAVKSEREYYDAMEKIERWEIENKPETEADEVREIYTKMGFDEKTVERLTGEITADKELWLETMMRYELGLTKEESPRLSGIVIGFFYLIAGLPPILPFLFIGSTAQALEVSIGAAVIVMALIGFWRWRLNKGSLFAKMGETILIGLVAAGIGLVAGLLLSVLGVATPSV